MNSIYPNISSISASLHHKPIYITLSHMAILLCIPRYSSGMCIPQWLHRERGSGPSFRILILAFQCRIMGFSLNLTELCALARHPSTRHANDFNTSGKDTTYVSSPLPPMSTPLVCGMNILWDCYMWWRINNSAIFILQYLKITLFLFH